VIDFSIYRFHHRLGCRGVFWTRRGSHRRRAADTARPNALARLRRSPAVGNVTAGLIAISGWISRKTSITAGTPGAHVPDRRVAGFLWRIIQIRLKEPEKWVVAARKQEGRPVFVSALLCLHVRRTALAQVGVARNAPLPRGGRGLMGRRIFMPGVSGRCYR